MSQAKRGRKEQYLENNGFTKCVEHGGMFRSKYGEIICEDCWKQKLKD